MPNLGWTFIVGLLALAAGHDIGSTMAALESSACPGGNLQCGVVQLVKAAYNSVGCPASSKELCEDLDGWVKVLQGISPPTFANQHYIIDLTKLIKGYSNTFYGESEQCCTAQLQNETCCNHTSAQWPGVEAISILNNAEMVSFMTDVPKRVKTGSLTRSNMLGFLLLNDVYWYDLPEGERGLGLGGQPLEVHAYVRPVLDAIFGHSGDWSNSHLVESAAAFINSKKITFKKGDSKIWTQKILHKVAYGADISDKYAQEMVDFQADVLKTVIFPQDIVDLARKIPGGENLLYSALKFDYLKSRKDAYLAQWLPTISSRPDVQHLDMKEKSVVNSNVFDALVFAGGLSVPGVISPGIALLHSGSLSPSPGFQLSASNAEAFAWETTRYFPPVLGFAYVDSQKTYPLRIMAVGMGQRAGDAWGDDAETPTFRLRDMATYHKFWVGHADHAEDAEGAGTRRCPGKSLSMAMIYAWFKGWEQSAWEAAPGTNFKFLDFAPFIKDYKLVRRNPEFPDVHNSNAGDGSANSEDSANHQAVVVLGVAVAVLLVLLVALMAYTTRQRFVTSADRNKGYVPMT